MFLRTKYQVGDVVISENDTVCVITDVLMDGFYMVENIDAKENKTLTAEKIKPYYKVIKTIKDDNGNIIMSLTDTSNIKPLVEYITEKHHINHKKAIIKATSLIENGQVQINDSFYEISENQLFL